MTGSGLAASDFFFDAAGGTTCWLCGRQDYCENLCAARRLWWGSVRTARGPGKTAKEMLHFKRQHCKVIGYPTRSPLSGIAEMGLLCQ